MEINQQELCAWWLDVARQEAVQVVPKAVEYSAYDLGLIGQLMSDLLGQGLQEEGEKQELACWFYLIGKVGRAVGAMWDGRLPSDDTVHDLAVYTRMIRRIRDVGGWPGSAPQPQTPGQAAGEAFGRLGDVLKQAMESAT